MTKSLHVEGRELDVGNVTAQYRVNLSLPVTIVFVLLFLAVSMPNVLLWSKLDDLRKERNKEHLFWLLCQPGYTSQQRRQAFADLLWQGNREWRSARPPFRP